MHLDRTFTSVIAAAALSAVAAAGVLAQNPPKSTKRIPITKESPGEVVARVDTVVRVETVTNTVYRTDTLYQMRLRVDTVVQIPPPAPIRMPGGLYFGIAGGSSAPDGSIFTTNSMGYTGQMQLGWQHAKQGLGGRISGSYTGLGEDSQFSHGTNAQLWTMSTDLKFNIPLGHVFGQTPKLGMYGIGGWTYTWFKDLPRSLNTPNSGATVFVVGDSSWTGRSGWDAGGGFSLSWGRSEIFVESRVLEFGIQHSASARQIPIVLGFNWY